MPDADATKKLAEAVATKWFGKMFNSHTYRHRRIFGVALIHISGIYTGFIISAFAPSPMPYIFIPVCILLGFITVKWGHAIIKKEAE